MSRQGALIIMEVYTYIWAKLFNNTEPYNILHLHLFNYMFTHRKL